MNKKLTASLTVIAVSLITASLSRAALAQSSVTLYGTLDTGIDYISNQKTASA
jgi:GBP family porin